MTKTSAMLAVSAAFILALIVNTYITWHDHSSLTRLVHSESVQRVHTIGERCEATDHQAKVLHHNLPPSHQQEAAWFEESYRRCLRSLAKVERRAGVKYEP